MKIGSTPDVSLTADLALRAGTRPTQAPATASVGSTAEVAVSAAGAQLNGLSAGSDFDSNKVDAIRQAIREGRFSVNPGAIADRLIADAQSLLGPRVN